MDPLDEILRSYHVSEDPDGAREWEPPWPLNMMTEPKHVTASEAAILDDLSPLEMRDMDQIEDAASVEAKVRFPQQNGVNDTATAEAMDLYNNELGRAIAVANPDATPAELADLVEQAVNNGDTVVITLGEAGTTTAATVPGLPPMPTGAGPGGVYDPGRPGGYGTSPGGY